VSVLPAASPSGADATTRADPRASMRSEMRAASRPGPTDLVWAAALLALLAGVVALRYLAIEAALADPILIGLGFGVALAGVAAIGALSATGAMSGTSATRPASWPRTIALGLLGGGALVALALAGQAAASLPQLPTLIRGDAFVPWGIATIVVATGEEAVLRGVLFDRLTRGSGIWLAILITSLAFALMHVPFYGWRVVPLDLGVGIWLAGLRLASGGIVAPSIAHAVADLATWWL